MKKVPLPGFTLARLRLVFFSLCSLRTTTKLPRTLYATFLGASALFSLRVLAADPTPLVWRNPTPTSADINAITFANGQYVAVAQDDGRGNVLITTDGASWTFARCPTTNILRGIVFGGGVYVAVGDRGGIFSSTNALTWTRGTPAPPTLCTQWRMGTGNM